MNAAELLTLRASSPLRRPGWRWDLAKYLKDRPSAGRFLATDTSVGEAQTVLCALSDTPSESELVVVMGTLGPGIDAYQFWTAGQPAGPAVGGPGPKDPTDYLGPLAPAALARAQLEALILADKPAAVAAKVTGLSEAAVGYYEKWFFDVRDRLKSPGWVATNVIGPLLSPSPLVTLPNLIRAYGYYTKSTQIVRTVVGGFDQSLSRKAARDPSRFFAADAAAAGSLKAALAVRMMSLTDGKAYGRIIELHHEAVDIQAKAAGAVGSGDEEKFRSAAAALFGSMKRGYCEAPDEGRTFALNAPSEAG